MNSATKQNFKHQTSPNSSTPENDSAAEKSPTPENNAEQDQKETEPEQKIEETTDSEAKTEEPESTDEKVEELVEVNDSKIYIYNKKSCKTSFLTSKRLKKNN